MKILNKSEEKKIIFKDNGQNKSSPTIMMVDDDLSTMEVVQTFLETIGYRAFIKVENSREAMRILEETMPDLLLLDLIMPGVSGFDILAEVRKNPRFKHMPIIILTVSSSGADRIRALDLGVTEFLNKPVDPTELGLRVRNTLAAKAYQDQLAYYDNLTKLPNRQMFLEYMERQLKKAKRSGEQLAVLNIALDNLGKINASIGTNVADEVLCNVADRIRSAVRECDFLGHASHENDPDMNLFRMEGSTFSLLLNGIDHAESAAIVAERIIHAIREPLEIDGAGIYVKASIGISCYPRETEDRDTLLQLAGRAKDYIKNMGGDSLQFSSSAINDIYTKRRSLENSLRKALEMDEFVLYYQPKVCVTTNAVMGVEVLLRWENSEIGSIPPEEFVPVAEETGLIVPIGEWILSRALAQLAEWHKMDRKPIEMSVNLSARQFRDPEFYVSVEKIIKESRVDPHFLTLEITESLLMADIEQTTEILSCFKDLGIKLAIDDFGTGYSSFGYLSDLPVDELKIDKTFISGLPDKGNNGVIVSTLTFLAKNLGLHTVAEGVETPEQLRFLQMKGCNQYQGYLFSKPLTSTDLVKYLPMKS